MRCSTDLEELRVELLPLHVDNHGSWMPSTEGTPDFTWEPEADPGFTGEKMTWDCVDISVSAWGRSSSRLVGWLNTFYFKIPHHLIIQRLPYSSIWLSLKVNISTIKKAIWYIKSNKIKLLVPAVLLLLRSLRFKRAPLERTRCFWFTFLQPPSLLWDECAGMSRSEELINGESLCFRRRAFRANAESSWQSRRFLIRPGWGYILTAPGLLKECQHPTLVTFVDFLLTALSLSVLKCSFHVS